MKCAHHLAQCALCPSQSPLIDSTGQPGVPWPELPCDLPLELTKIETSHGGFGGCVLPAILRVTCLRISTLQLWRSTCRLSLGRYDLSSGGETVPLQWVNEVDASVPPAILYSRRCINVDVHPEWISRPARACSNCQVEYTTSDLRNRCRLAGFPGKPEGPDSECNWRCSIQNTCDDACCRRSLQRGAGHRLQVFRHVTKGWCLRTLGPIKKDSFIMEYVAERLSPERQANERSNCSPALYSASRLSEPDHVSPRSNERKLDNPDVETYIMELERAAKNHTHLDALSVRNQVRAWGLHRTFGFCMHLQLTRSPL